MTFLAMVTVMLVVPILKSNLKRNTQHEHGHLKKNPSHLAGLSRFRVFIWDTSPRWDPGKIKRDLN